MKNQAPNFKFLSEEVGSWAPNQQKGNAEKEKALDSLLSESVEGQVPVDVLQAVVPVEDHVALTHASNPLNN